MDAIEPNDRVAEFTRALLYAGDMLFGLAAGLVEALPEDAYPGENPGAVVIEMMTGTIRTAFSDVDPRDVEVATELIGEACDRVIEHLQLALELRRRMEGGAGGGQRRYG